MSHIIRKPVYAICEQQRRRSAAHSRSLISTFVFRCLDRSSFCIRNFKTLASFCSWAVTRFESYLVAIPEHRFSRDEAQYQQKKLFSTWTYLSQLVRKGILALSGKWNFKRAYAAIQWGPISGFVWSSCSSLYCVKERRRPSRDYGCAKSAENSLFAYVMCLFHKPAHLFPFF